VRVVVLVGLLEAQAARAEKREAVVSTDEVADFELALAAALDVQVLQRLAGGVVDAGEIPLEERSELREVSVYHNSLADRSVLRSAELIDEVAELVEVGIALIGGVVCDG